MPRHPGHPAAGPARGDQPGNGLHPPSWSAFQTDNRDQLDCYLSDLYGSTARSTGLTPGQNYRSVLMDVGPFTVHRVQAPIRLTVRIEPMTSFVFIHQRNGTFERTIQERGPVDHRIGKGDVLLNAQPGQALRSSADQPGAHIVRLDPTLLAQLASTAPARTPAALRFTEYLPRSERAAQHWVQTYCYVEQMLDNAEAASHPLILGSAARLLAAAALAVFPNTALTDPTGVDRRDATSRTVRRAIAFIEANPDRDLSVADVAADACVTIRAVQLAFRRHLDTTPTAYLRRIRLDRAHHDLLEADPHRTTVAQVAARWGFASHSRFAASYREAYGVAPSRTLRTGIGLDGAGLPTTPPAGGGPAG